MLAIIIEVNSSFLTVAIHIRYIKRRLIRPDGLSGLMHHRTILVADDDIYIINSGIATDVNVVAVGGTSGTTWGRIPPNGPKGCNTTLSFALADMPMSTNSNRNFSLFIFADFYTMLQR